MGTEQILAEAERLAALGDGPRHVARDPVNVPMIHHWTDALGDDNPAYAEPEFAPPAMIQVWTMPGLRGRRSLGADPNGQLNQLLTDAGFTGVVATNCEQTYLRPLRIGERPEVATRVDGLAGPKRTALGEGFFLTSRYTWYVGDEPVAEMLFRVLRFRPGTGKPAPTAEAEPGPYVLRPAVNADTAYFWEGTAAGELRIQRCTACGALRHPPGPMCPDCGAGKREYQVASGRGTVFSYVVHHHPPVPGKKPPFTVALVELEEGVRMLGEVLGAEPGDVTIGAPVRVAFDKADEDLVLPAWRLALPGELPELRIPLTPTFVVSTAVATRDFQDVHHDRDRALAGGSKDIFLNILTTTGLVQRFVTDWAGPSATVESIAIRLGAPAYPYDMLTLSGRVTARDGDTLTVEVRGAVPGGDHVTGTVRLTVPGGGPDASEER